MNTSFMMHFIVFVLLLSLGCICACNSSNRDDDTNSDDDDISDDDCADDDAESDDDMNGDDAAGDDAGVDDDTSEDDDSNVDDDIGTDDDTSDDDLIDILPRSAPPENLYVLDIEDLDFSAQVLAASLQGLVSRQRPEIYLVGLWPNDSPNVPGTDAFLEFYKSHHGVTTMPVSNVWELVDHYSDRFSEAVVYDPNLPETLDIATTIAGLDDLLIVHPDLLPEAEAHGVTLTTDLRGLWTNKYQAFDWAVENLLPRCSQVAVADLDPQLLGPRDYLIENRFFVFRYKAVPGEFFRLTSILNHYPNNLPVLGYLASTGSEENLGEIALSTSGAFLIPSDFAPNFSVHSGIEVDPAVFVQPPVVLPDLTPEQIGDSVFAAFAFSDGDNYQIPLHMLLIEWADPTHGQAPITWTIPGTMPTLAPGVAEYFYMNRSTLDRFATISGVGYVYPSLYPDRETLAALTSEYVRYLGIDVIWLIDPSVSSQLPWFIDGYLRQLAEEGNLRGFMANYGRGIKTHDFTSNGVPILYTMISCGDNPVTTMEQVIDEAKADKSPGKPAYAFFGVSIWTTMPSDILEVLNAFQPDETVRPVSVSQMLELMMKYPPGW